MILESWGFLGAASKLSMHDGLQTQRVMQHQHQCGSNHQPRAYLYSSAEGADEYLVDPYDHQMSSGELDVEDFQRMLNTANDHEI